MAFASNTVSLRWENNSLILQRGLTVIQILPEDATQLRTMKGSSEFTEYFRSTALKNREARRVFQSWERKDAQLLQKLHQEMTAEG